MKPNCELHYISEMETYAKPTCELHFSTHMKPTCELQLYIPITLLHLLILHAKDTFPHVHKRNIKVIGNITYKPNVMQSFKKVLNPNVNYSQKICENYISTLVLLLSHVGENPNVCGICDNLYEKTI